MSTIHIHVHKTKDANPAALSELIALVNQINKHIIVLPTEKSSDNTNDDLNWLKRAVDRALQLEKML